LVAPSGLRLNVLKDACLIGRMTAAELGFLAELVDAGELRTFIDREYPLERIVEAHAYVRQGHKRGHVVVKIS
jgi:NADPH:quinone reductase-like Zn-dependent oxidoreductase